MVRRGSLPRLFSRAGVAFGAPHPMTAPDAAAAHRPTLYIAAGGCSLERSVPRSSNLCAPFSLPLSCGCDTRGSCFFVALLGWGRATAAGTEQDLENGGGEAAGRPALRQPVLTDEQRDEIREAFDLYVPCRLCYFGSWRRARLCGSDELCDGLSMVAPVFLCCLYCFYLLRGGAHGHVYGGGVR